MRFLGDSTFVGNVALQSNLSVSRITFSNANITLLSTQTEAAQIGTMTAARTVTLPTASSAGAGVVIWITDESGTVTTTNNITVAAASGDTVNGAASVALINGYSVSCFVSNGVSKWTADPRLLQTLARPLVQTSFNEITSDTTTTSTTFVDLLTNTLTTGANSVIIQLNSSSQNSTANSTIYFQIVVDGVVKRGAATFTKTVAVPTGCSLAYKMAVTAGSHTIKIQWKVDIGTGGIKPVTSPTTDSCSMTIQEVSV